MYNRNYGLSYEDAYMNKLASVQAYGVTADEAYAAMNDAAAAYDECLYKAAYAQEAYENALATLQGAEAMYYENMDKVAYAQDLYADAASRLGYNKTAAEYVPLPETALQATMTQGRLPAVRQGEPGSQPTSPVEAYAAAARAEAEVPKVASWNKMAFDDADGLRVLKGDSIIPSADQMRILKGDSTLADGENAYNAARALKGDVAADSSMVKALREQRAAHEIETAALKGQLAEMTRKAENPWGMIRTDAINKYEGLKANLLGHATGLRDTIAGGAARLGERAAGAFGAGADAAAAFGNKVRDAYIENQLPINVAAGLTGAGGLGVFGALKRRGSGALARLKRTFGK